MKARRICLFALFLTSFLQVLQGEEDFKLVFLENRATKVEMEIMLAGAQYILLLLPRDGFRNRFLPGQY
jgi:hypothetical protein